MALVPLYLIVFLSSLLHFVAAQQTNGSVSVGASLTATPDAEPWLSSSGEFAFGFQLIQGKDYFLLSIWYDKIPEKTIIWYPEGGPTVSTGLVLSDPRGKEVWSSDSLSDLAYGYMNDTGNFVIEGSNSRNIWESFDHPADTMLPTQIMVKGGVINSKMDKTNFAGGRFHTGYMYILRRNGERFDLTVRGSLPSGDYYHRATLDSDGVFTKYYHPKNPTEGTSWRVIWFVPENICTTKDSKACGLNNVCSFDDNRPNCECPLGFSLLDPNTPYGDCKPDFTPSCDEGESNHGGDVLDFIELNNIDWPFSDYVHMNPSNEQTCRTSCLNDCFCAVAIYRDNQCWKKQLPLANGKKDLSQNVKAFLKFRKTDGPRTGENKSGTGENKSRKTWILGGSVLLSTSVLGIVLLISVIYVCFFQIHKKVGNSFPDDTIIKTNISRFTYQKLIKATDGFKDALGKGAFGKVYKGVIGTKIVAVKKLETVVQDGQRELKTEVNTIARTHHKNLVQLLGYCDDGEKRLLIYEYMSNGTLAFFLFGGMRPSWKHRSYIAVSIAKGLTYLHEDCSNQIIHCDIKPQNILLDDCYNAKIADFGMAKLLMINQSRTNTGIRGTKGYVAPEWFRNTLVTVKSVVFNDHDAEDAEVLVDLAWDCYQEGRLDAFVKNDSEALDDFEKLTIFMRVGLWCVQENPSLRPTMKKVIQMLEGVIEVTEPPCLCPFSVSSC
ncbi:putative protein kinase RLK-Pelle-SD-2b family [Helianthus annuus]|nr:putative protein kinase RLK-Pelle-SD-2b family [Helianthus annuus]